MITSPLTRPLCGSLLRGVTSGGGMPAPVSGVTWDPATASATLVLSNGNLTATAQNSSGGFPRSTVAAGGVRATRFIPVFTGAPEDQEAPAVISSDSVTIGVCADGFMMLAGGAAGTGPTFASGDEVDVLTDSVTGDGWYRVNGVGSGDAEAGTGPNFTFPPGTEFYAGSLTNGIYSLDENPSCSLTLDPTYSSGRFAARSA